MLQLLGGQYVEGKPEFGGVIPRENGIKGGGGCSYK